MATITPRVNVLLTKRQHEVITSMSRDSGQSMSKIIQELIEPSMPVLERLAVTYQHIRRAKQADRDRIVEAAQEAQDALEPLINQSVDQIDLFLTGLEKAFPVREKEKKEPKKEGAKAAPNVSRPPLTNRGVTPPIIKPRKALGRKGSGEILKKKVFSKKGGVSGGSKS